VRLAAKMGKPKRDVPLVQPSDQMMARVQAALAPLTQVSHCSIHPLLPSGHHHTGNNNNEHAYAGQLNSFAHLRALLVLHDRGILGPGRERRWEKWMLSDGEPRCILFVFCNVANDFSFKKRVTNVDHLYCSHLESEDTIYL
jgi:hypothetical protein